MVNLATQLIWNIYEDILIEIIMCDNQIWVKDTSYLCFFPTFSIPTTSTNLAFIVLWNCSVTYKDKGKKN